MNPGIPCGLEKIADKMRTREGLDGDAILTARNPGSSFGD
jgi:hypothetical protein